MFLGILNFSLLSQNSPNGLTVLNELNDFNENPFQFGFSNANGSKSGGSAMSANRLLSGRFCSERNYGMKGFFAGMVCVAATALMTVLTPGQALAADDIVDTAVKAKSFTTLVTAVKAAGLVEALKGEGPFTVFAPTDEAFAKVPKDVLEGLLADKEKLAAVLKYHVVAGKVMAADVEKLDSAKTLQGTTVAIDATGGMKVNNAKVIKADIKCKNGVIHVIDTVLIPK